MARQDDDGAGTGSDRLWTAVTVALWAIAIALAVWVVATTLLD
ncbi:MAG: hypothetical protein ACJ739_17560 [Acidimicrobiales bacterium]